MDREQYRRIEGRLYGLSERPVARIASPRIRSPQPRAPGPRGPFAEIVPRLDLDIAMHHLTADEVQVVRDHYITGDKSHPGQVRRRIIKKLGATLDSE